MNWLRQGFIFTGSINRVLQIIPQVLLLGRWSQCHNMEKAQEDEQGSEDHGAEPASEQVWCGDYNLPGRRCRQENPRPGSWVAEHSNSFQKQLSKEIPDSISPTGLSNLPIHRGRLAEVQTIPDVCISLGCQGDGHLLGRAPEHAWNALERPQVVVRETPCHVWEIPQLTLD